MTPYQESQIIPHRDQWLNYILSCKNRLDIEKAKKGIEWLYKFCGKKQPAIIFMDSPFGCQVAANFFKQIISTDEKNEATDNIRDNIRANIRNGKLEYQTTSYYGNVGDYGWVAWIDYFLQMDLIKTDKEADFNHFKELMLSGVFEMIQFDGICFVSNMPTKLERNGNGRLHSVSGTAVEFSDGYFQYYIHGVNITTSLYQKLSDQSFTFQDWVKEGNEEVKSAILAFMEEKWGSEYFFRFISDNLKEIETYTDKKPAEYLKGTTGGMNIGVYTLFKGSVNNIELAFVRCYCPSTDRMFFLSVDPVHKNAKDAIASLYRVPNKLKTEISYIQRQGERFSTVFTEKGNTMLSEMSKEDVADLVTIPGEEYFSKMKYEF